MNKTTSVFLSATLAFALVCSASHLHAQNDGPTIGQPAPEFSLTDTNGSEHSLTDYRGEWVVLEWLNYGCPYVRKHYDSGNMQQLQQTYGERGVKWFAIVSSAPGKQGYYPPDEMNARSADIGNEALAVLLDPEGNVGHMYDATTTPHMFVINPDGILLYNGAIDDQPSSRASSLEGAHNYVSAALDEAMNGHAVSIASSQPYGCSVKY